MRLSQLWKAQSWFELSSMLLVGLIFVLVLPQQTRVEYYVRKFETKHSLLCAVCLEIKE